MLNEYLFQLFRYIEGFYLHIRSLIRVWTYLGWKHTATWIRMSGPPLTPSLGSLSLYRRTRRHINWLFIRLFAALNADTPAGRIEADRLASALLRAIEELPTQ